MAEIRDAAKEENLAEMEADGITYQLTILE
jgi:hypothetical protein